MRKIFYVFSICFLFFLTSCNENSTTLNHYLYEVTFVTNCDLKIENIQTNSEGKVNKPDNPTLEGYEFKGWYYDCELTIPFSFDTVLNRNITLYAKWAIKEIKVSLINDDDIFLEYSYFYGDKLEKIENPTLEGYEFLGLYYDKDFSEIYDSTNEIILTDDLNFYIKWNVKTLTIHTYIDGVESQSYSEDYNSLFNVIPKPVKNQYTFDGWYLDENYQKKIKDSECIQDNLKLYGRFILNKYTISFYDQSGFIESIKADCNSLIIDLFHGSKEGYHLDGLYFNQDYSQKISDDELLNNDQNVYVKWEINNYDVNLYVDGILYKSLKLNHFEYLSNIMLPSKEHYVFSGWYFDDLLTEKVDSEIIITENIRLYGKFDLEKITINIYDGNQIFKKVMLEYGNKLKEIEEVSKMGYTFINYYEDENLQTIIDLEMIITTDLNVYTKWEINSYEINLIIDSNNTVVLQKKYKETLSDLANPVKEGYLFGGWYKDSSFKTIYQLKTEISNDITLYAKWIDINKVPYKIVYKLENISNSNYTKTKEVIQYGKLNESVSAQIIDYPGFTPINTDIFGTVTFDSILTLEVLYKRNCFSVTYYVEEEIYEVVHDVKYGTTYQIPSNFLVDDAILYGWYMDQTFENECMSISNIKEDTVLYGKIEHITLGTIGLEYALNEDEKSYSVISYTGTASKLIIPNGYNHFPITSITSLSESNVITEVIISNNINTIKNNAFKNCYNLKTITIPNTLEVIESFAFLNCRNLQEIKLGARVEKIEIGAFYNCQKLENIEVDSSNEVYYSENGVLFDRNYAELIVYPSNKMESAYFIPSGITSIARTAFMNNPHLHNIELGNDVTNISSENFINCSALTTVILGSKVKYINETVFNQSNELQEILVDSNNENYVSVDGVLYNKTQRTLIKYPSGKTGELFIIPTTVEVIQYNCFSSCKNLKSIILADGIKYIEEQSFIFFDDVIIYVCSDSYLSTWHQNAFYGKYEILYENQWILIDGKPTRRNNDE